MKFILYFLLRGNYFKFEKRYPAFTLDQKIKKSQDSVSSLIYLGVILPLLIWAMAGYFLLVGKVTVSKWIGAWLFALVSLPLLLVARKRIRKMDFYSDDKLKGLSRNESRFYLLLVVSLVAIFFLSMIFSVIFIRKMQFG